MQLCNLDEDINKWGESMDIQILKEFADLAYTLNFGKTAERMYVGQSTLSKHIIALEKELGTQLFIRTKQAVRLTSTGQNILPEIKKVIEHYEDAVNIIKQDKGDLCGSLRIGFLDAAVRTLLTNSIQKYRALYPNMKLSLTSCQVGDLADGFKNNVIDIALTILFPNSVLPPDTSFTAFYEDGISAVFPGDHPLASKETIVFDDLLQYPIILPSPQMYPSYAQLIREYEQNSPVPANIICDYTHIDTALIMVESGMGVSILPTNIGSNATTAVFRPISDCNPVLQIGVMWKKGNRTIGMEEFIDILTDEANSLNH